MAELLRVDNDGPRIVGTNYLDTEWGRQGCVFVSVNAGCFRVLVPRQMDGLASETREATMAVVFDSMHTAR
jgi:hypothetical protein